MLFEAERIINNARLTHVYPNTIETCLTSNHLLFCRQSLYSSNRTSTVVRNLTVLSSTTDKLSRNINHFFVDLRYVKQASKLNISSLKIKVNDIVLVFYEKVPRRFWRIAIVTRAEILK